MQIFKSNLRGLFFFSALIFLFLTKAYGVIDLTDIGIGARSMGMGGAYAGFADDSSAIFTNPAGLAKGKDLGFISMNGTMLGDINYFMLGASDNSPLGRFGLGYLNASTGGIPLTTITGTGSTAVVSQYGTTDYNNGQVFISYGNKLGSLTRGKFGDNISIGAAVKFFLQGFSGGGAPMQDANGAGMDADLGLQFEPNNWANVGLVCKNFLPAGFGGKFVWKSRNGEPEVVEGVPMSWRLGGRFKIIGPIAIKSNSSQKLDLIADYENQNQVGRPSLFHVGVEYAPQETLALRFGVDQKPKAGESGIGVDNNLTFGVGMNFRGFTFDYAYHRFGEISDNSAHFFSIGYKGPEEVKTVKTVKEKKEEKQNNIPFPTIVPKPKLINFTDVPSDYFVRMPIEYLSTLGIMSGYPDNTFKPKKEITRSDFAELLVKAKGFDVGNNVKIKFLDVPIGSDAAPYISMAVEKGYIQGYPDGTFLPDGRISRAEAALVMARFSGVYLKKRVRQKPFPDVAVGHWAAPSIAADKELGYFEYLSGKSFSPASYLTRGEAAEIISKTPFAKAQIDKLLSGKK
ncbi:MAG: S-layer homology domain-containing protein [Candidatus Margulisiibacteriota bacterium]